MPFANPIYDPAKRIIQFPAVQMADRWPKAASQFVCIFEAVNVAGAALCGEEWTRGELLAVSWPESPRGKRMMARLVRPTPPIPHSLANPYQKRPAKPEPIEHVNEWHTEKLNEQWEANGKALKRLNQSVDWIAQKCRDGELKAFWRFRLGGGPLREMNAYEWNVDAPLFTFVSEGGNTRYCRELKNQGPWETFVFFEKQQLLDVLKREPDAPLIVAEADLARLSPYLRLAVHVALQRRYFDRDSCETKDSREAEIEAAWNKFIPDIAPVRSTVEHLAKLMTFPNPEAIGQGQKGARSRKSGGTLKA